MTEVESKVVEAWQEAAEDLGIQFSSPFAVSIRGKEINSIGFVHRFGRRLGTLISVLNEPSSLTGLIGDWRDEDYFISVLGKGYAKYNRQLFIETLDDLQFFGPETERPSWYKGTHW